MNFSAFRHFGSRGSFFAQSNPIIVSHREEVMRLRNFGREFRARIFNSRRFEGVKYIILEFGAGTRRSSKNSLPFLSYHVPVITTVIATMSISFHRPCTASLRNRDFPRPFVTLGISCRGSRRVKPRVNCLGPIQISFYVFYVGMQIKIRCGEQRKQ